MDEQCKKRIIVADDHEVLRKSLITSMNMEPDMVVIGEAVDGADAVSLARHLKPDIVIMDANMPVMNGITAIKILKSEFPCLPILGLSAYAEEEVAAEMIKAGAFAYVTKDSRIEDVVGILRSECHRLEQDREGRPLGGNLRAEENIT